MRPLLPQPVRETMRSGGVKALEVEQRIDEARRRGIAVVDGDHVGAERVAEIGLVAQRVLIGLADHVARELRMIQPLGDAMHDRVLEPLVMQHRRIDEGRKLRFAPDDFFRFLPDMRPDRIELAQGGLRIELGLGHGVVPAV